MGNLDDHDWEHDPLFDRGVVGRGPAPNMRHGTPQLIYANRRVAAATAVMFFGLLAAGTTTALREGSLEGFLLVVLFVGIPGACYGRQALSRRPRLIVSDAGVEDVRTGTFIRWQDVSSARVTSRQGAYGEYHHLVLELDAPLTPETKHRALSKQFDVTLDQLSLSWSDAVDLIEARSRLCVQRPPH